MSLSPVPVMAQKQVIFLDGYLGWAYSMPPYHTAHREEIEKLPFSGFVVPGNIYTNYTMSADPNSNNVTYSRVWNEVKSLKNIYKKKTHNFLRINLDFPGDFWDDAVWQQTADNFAAVAEAAKNIGFKGILFDDEAYAGGQHTHAHYMSNFKFPKKQDVQDHPENYGDWEISESEENRGDWVDYKCRIDGQTVENSEDCAYRNPAHTFKEHMDKVASRFKAIMQAMEAKYPNITVLVLHGPATAHPKTNIAEHYIKPNGVFETNEYKGAMFLGLKQGLNGSARLHDMGEFYQYNTEQHFQNAYQWRKYDIVSNQYNQGLDDSYRWVIPLNDRPSWSNDIKIGYMVSDYALEHDLPEYDIPNLCHPVEVESRLTKALDHSDEYVIYYSDSDLSTCEDDIRWADISAPVAPAWLDMMQGVYDDTQAFALLPGLLNLLLFDNSHPSPGEVVIKPSYQDAANIPELTGDWYGAMGEHPVRKLSMPSPWPAYSGNTERNIDLYFPSNVPGKKPTVFFIAGWGMYHSEQYKSFLYFIASQGFNAVFIPYTGGDAIGNPTVLLDILDGIVDGPWKSVINTDKVGYSGHSSGGGLIFYLAQQRPNWGTQGRFLFPVAAWWGFHLAETGNIQLPANTNMIVQVGDDDNGTDPRQNIDFLLHSNISVERKSYLYLPGDANHPSNHQIIYSKFENGIYSYDALDQVGLYRPLESLMRYSFGTPGGDTWKAIGLPDDGDANYNVMDTINGISVLSTDDPLANHNVPIPLEQDLDSRYLCSKSGNSRYKMCMPCKDTSRDQAWQQCPAN